MKKIIASASAILLSSSALAATVPTFAHYPVGNYAWTANPMLTEAAWNGAMTYAEASNWTGDKPMELTAEQIAEKEAWLASKATDATGTVDKPAELSAEQIAEKDAWLATNTVEQVNAEMADAKVWTGETFASKPAETEFNGVGGPDESAEAERTSWPACDPGPGDDRCIQLYEPGVRGAFAQWSAGREQMAMGGPEEPIGKDAMALSSADMSGSTVDKPLIGAEPTTEPTGVQVAKTATPFEHASMSSNAAFANYDGDGVLTAEEMQAGSAFAQQDSAAVYTGVGGPLEEVRDYPRCRSRSDDRCQQGS